MASHYVQVLVAGKPEFRARQDSAHYFSGVRSEVVLIKNELYLALSEFKLELTVSLTKQESK